VAEDETRIKYVVYWHYVSFAVRNAPEAGHRSCLQQSLCFLIFKGPGHSSECYICFWMVIETITTPVFAVLLYDTQNPSLS